MKRFLLYILLLPACYSRLYGQFTPGNLVVYNVSGTTSASSVISLLEYNTSGSLITTNTLPSSGAVKITTSAIATSEGHIGLDAEQTHLIVPGYNAPTGIGSITSTSSAAYNRELFTVSPANVATLAYSRDIFSGNNIRCGTANGTNYYAGGALNGIVLMNGPTTVSSTVANNRVVHIYNGQLYFTTGNPGSEGLYKVGTGIPTAGGTISTPVISTGGSSSLFGFSISPDGNTIYLVDDNASGSAAGILKYVWTGSTYTSTIISATPCRGLTVDYSANPFIIYATTANSPGNALIRIIDNGTTFPVSTLATATSTNNFRGVSLVPAAYAKIRGTDTFCSGGSSKVIFYGNPGGTINYTVNGIANAHVLSNRGVDTLNTGTIINSDANDSIITYSLVSIVTSIGTTTVSGSAVITVNPPVPAAVAGPSSVCTGAPITLTDATTGGTWSSRATAVATATPAGMVYGVSPGTATIVYTILSTCGTITTNKIVTVTPLPDAGTISGPASVCAGSNITVTDPASGGAWSRTNSTASISGGTVTGLMPGTDTIRYTVSNICSTATATKTISVFPLPTVFTVSGGGGYCPGSTGVMVNLSGSQTGTDYQLFYGSSPSGAPAHGSGLPLSFGPLTGAGTYTISATETTTLCSSNMAGSVTVSLYSVPAAQTISGGGAFCTGETGRTINMSSSQTGVNYQLYRGSTATGAPVAGTGSPITFGPLSVAGTYTVSATNTTTLCTNNMTGSATITVNTSPLVQTISGTGSYCTGGTGVIITMSGSETGVNYQLYRGPATAGPPATGTGAAMTFGPITAAGTYTVSAINPSTLCPNNMAGSATITVNARPSVQTVGGGGAFCAGSSGATITLSGSEAGVSYQLFNGSVPAGSPVAGTGAALTFGPLTAAGTYTVSATNSTTFCTNSMAGTATITVNALPIVQTVSGSGGYCTGSGGITIMLSGSETGVRYQLYLGSATSGSPVGGTGSAFTFGPLTAAGTYTVSATNISTLCTNNMAGSATLALHPLPLGQTVSGGGRYCAGGTGVIITLSGSETGVNYQLYNGSVTYGPPVAGTGSPMTLGPITVAGTYTVSATNISTLCANNMAGAATITVNPLPVLQSVSGGGAFCAGGSGAVITLGGSETGVNYQLHNGSVPVGSTAAGTGSSINFGPFTAAGTYTVSAVNASTLCANNMAGSATITVHPIPMVQTLTGGGNYCAGGAGVAIGLSGSEAGVSYQLYNGTSAYGTPVAGTGSAISFGTITAAGTFTVSATNTATACMNNMAGSATITINPLPLSQTVTGGGAYCSGGSGAMIGLNSSEAGVNYQLFNGSSAFGVPMSGTGSPLSFGSIATAGVYTVYATNITTLCSNNMAGSASIIVNTLPAVQTVTGGGSYCAGGGGIAMGLSSSETSVSYQPYCGSSPYGSPVTGTGGAITFGSVTVAGTYTVSARNVTTSCSSNMAGSATISINPIPVAGSISGPTSLCPGTATTLSSSVTGGTWSSSNANASVTGGLVTGNQTGIDTITYFVTNSCGTATTDVVVHIADALPVHILTHPDNTLCVNSMYQNFGADQAETPGSILTWTIYNGTLADLSQNKQYCLVNFSGAGPCTVILSANTIGSGCISSDTFRSNVGPRVVSQPDVIYSYPMFICLDNTPNSYQWGYDDKTTLDSTILAGEGNQNYYNPNPDLPDRRYWVMTNYHGCLQKSYYYEPSGLNQIKDHDLDITLYPNPANDDLYISVKGADNTDTFDWILSDVWGKHKMAQTLMNGKTALNISKLSPGVYVLVLYKNGTKVGYRTIVKE